MMNVKVRRLMKACALMILLSGCSSAIKYPSYYTLSIAPEIRPAHDADQRVVTVAVQRFVTPPYIRQGRLVFRENPEKVGFYEYHRWATDPGTSVTAALVEGLRSGNRIPMEEPPYSRDQFDYVLSGRIERLDEIDFDGGVKVEARIFAELRDGRTGEAIWSGEATQRQPVDRRGVDDVVKQMNRALQSSVDQLLQDIEKNISPKNQARR
jgi:uncharacterized lipoprotein YmbA